MPLGSNENLERARENLYRRQFSGGGITRSRFFRSAASTPVYEPPRQPRGGGRIWRWLFIFSLTFFLAAAGWSFVVFWGGERLVSADNIALSITGPREVGAGDEVSWEVTLTNQNQTTIESVFLIVEYPTLSRSLATGVNTGLTRERLSLGQLAAGATEKKTLRAVVFGELNSVQTLRVTVEYRLADSNAIFDKTSEANLLISSTPVVLTLDLPDEINSRQEITGRVVVRSNTETVLDSLNLTLEYPPGFTFLTATPAPVVSENRWRLGDLAAGAERTVIFRGVIAGQDGDRRAFRANVGLAGSDEPQESLATIYDSAIKEVGISRPLLAVSLTANGISGGEVVIPLDELVRVDLGWENNLAEELTAAELTVSLTGEIIDKRSVNAPNGFYQSGRNEIVWNRQTLPLLARLMPGDDGKTSFNFTTLSFRDLAANFNRLAVPEIKLVATLRGRRLAPGGQAEIIEQTESLTLKTQTVVQLSGQVWHAGGPLANHGPIPPRVGEETSYTIAWSVVNALNEVADVAVVATLPSYVRWLDSVSPPDSGLVFDEENGRVTWSLGGVAAGVGLSGAAREVFFRVALAPSLSQVGTSPVLVSEPVLTGRDVVTNTTVGYEIRNLTTAVNDVGSRPGDDKVVE